MIDKHPAYGIKRIKAELEASCQVVVGRDTLGKLLKLWGLGLRRKMRANKQSMIQKILLAIAGRANLLIRTVIIRPLQAITSDITELKYGGGKAYLCVHKDVFGQMVYGWSLGLTMEARLVMASFEAAKKAIKPFRQNMEKIVFHQDRGSQYTGYAYVAEVLKDDVLSYSDPGTPTHNPGQESFFGRFKDEWKEEIAEIQTFEKLEMFVAEKIHYYNYERRHTSIDYISPWDYTQTFLKKTA